MVQDSRVISKLLPPLFRSNIFREDPPCSYNFFQMLELVKDFSIVELGKISNLKGKINKVIRCTSKSLKIKVLKDNSVRLKFDDA